MWLKMYLISNNHHSLSFLLSATPQLDPNWLYPSMVHSSFTTALFTSPDQIL